MIDAIKQLDTKQKVTLVITLALFAFVIFYGYDTFFDGGGGSTNAPAPVVRTEEAPPAQPRSAPEPSSAAQPGKMPGQNPTQQPVANNGMAQNAPGTPGSTSMPAAAAPTNQGWQGNQQSQPAAAPAPQITVQAPAAPTAEQLALLKESQEVQQEYLRLVNEYQLAQLKQKLEQANADIAQAQLRSAQTMAQIQLLADKLKEETAPPSSPLAPATSSGEAKQPSVTFQLVYVGKQSGKWTAMLNAAGSYFEVSEGTLLSDGSVVREINSKGIILSLHGKKEFLTIPKGLD